MAYCRRWKRRGYTGNNDGGRVKGRAREGKQNAEQSWNKSDRNGQANTKSGGCSPPTRWKVIQINQLAKAVLGKREEEIKRSLSFAGIGRGPPTKNLGNC